ncbi:MAG: N-acetylmuramic acid 6-phosphate etherase [Nitrospirae bacterium]|nr:N-acetylmuramic acid 6-phosphate etherase [Nitrospirota bacterium]
MSPRPLDEMRPEEILALMDRADARAMDAVSGAREVIARAAARAAEAVRGGGRLIYVGAGTSGRLGILDASECPPTFSSKPEQVVGIIAGGRKAIQDAVEGAEDDRDAGRLAMARLKVSANDMVMGITASGTTPYVISALDAAHGRGASVWLLACQRKLALPMPALKGQTILLDTGKEVVQGSSRLAAGTATKLALNRITTACFIMLGKVHGDLMVDVMPTNAKLVKRACGIIQKLTGCGEDEALRLLDASGGSAKVAVVMKAKGIGRKDARKLLEEKGGFLRKALKA